MGSSSRCPLQFTHSVCNNIFGVNVKMTTQLRRVNLWCVYNEWTICGALQCNCKILSNVMRQLCWRGGERGGGDITAAKPQPVQATFSQTPPVHMLPVEFFLHCFTFYFYKTTHCSNYFFLKTTTCLPMESFSQSCQQLLCCFLQNHHMLSNVFFFLQILTLPPQ